VNEYPSIGARRWMATRATKKVMSFARACAYKDAYLDAMTTEPAVALDTATVRVAERRALEKKPSRKLNLKNRDHAELVDQLRREWARKDSLRELKTA